MKELGDPNRTGLGVDLPTLPHPPRDIPLLTGGYEVKTRLPNILLRVSGPLPSSEYFQCWGKSRGTRPFLAELGALNRHLV